MSRRRGGVVVSHLEVFDYTLFVYIKGGVSTQVMEFLFLLARCWKGLPLDQVERYQEV